MKLDFVTLDVFTTVRFKGNQLAIVHVPHLSTITYDQKLAIAKEFNLAETVFILEPSDPSASDIPVNIFLQHTEIPFAGHPTIGTGIYLLHYLKRPTKSITPAAGQIGLSFDPSALTISASIPHNIHLDSHTIAQPLHVPSSTPIPIFSIVPGMTFYLVPLPSLSDLSSAKTGLPDPRGSLDEGWQDGFRGTSYYVDMGKDDEGRRLLRTRWHGAEEDPFEDAATGSASCALGCYLSLHAESAIGSGSGIGETFEFHVIQGVEMGRESHIFVKVELTDGGKAIEKCILTGSAVKVQEGSIELDD